MSLTKRIQGITLVEVMIAIYVFGIGILVILRMVVANITRLYDIRNKDTAVGLAKEGIDLVFHQRDSNIEKGMPRYCSSVVLSGSSRVCERSFLSTGSSMMYSISRPITGLYYFQPLVATSATQLRYHSSTIYSLSGIDYNGTRYSHEITWGTATNFRRRISFTPVSIYPTYTGYILKVQSTVQYLRGGSIAHVVLESVVGDIR